MDVFEQALVSAAKAVAAAVSPPRRSAHKGGASVVDLLPGEVLLYIFSFLPHRDLAVLRATSRDLCALASDPVFYRTIAIKGRLASKTTSKDASRAWAHRLQAAPHVAAGVRRLSLSVCVWDQGRESNVDWVWPEFLGWLSRNCPQLATLSLHTRSTMAGIEWRSRLPGSLEELELGRCLGPGVYSWFTHLQRLTCLSLPNEIVAVPAVLESLRTAGCLSRMRRLHFGKVFVEAQSVLEALIESECRGSLVALSFRLGSASGGWFPLLGSLPSLAEFGIAGPASSRSAPEAGHHDHWSRNESLRVLSLWMSNYSLRALAAAPALVALDLTSRKDPSYPSLDLLAVLPITLRALRLSVLDPVCPGNSVDALLDHCPHLRWLSASIITSEAVVESLVGASRRLHLSFRIVCAGHEEMLTEAGHDLTKFGVGVSWRVPGGVLLSDDA